MEFDTPKKILINFALPTLRELCEKFHGIDFNVEGAALKCADMLHYRRMFAKFRRLSYFVSETEVNYRMLLYDELTAYKLYDFTEFEAANPI
jgi:hypothetical protein